MAFSKAPVQTEVKTLNAKKLDVNFDNDDFFNSFEPTPAATLTKEPSFSLEDSHSKFKTAAANSSKLQEVSEEDLKSSSKFTMNKQLSFGGTEIST